VIVFDRFPVICPSIIIGFGLGDKKYPINRILITNKTINTITTMIRNTTLAITPLEFKNPSFVVFTAVGDVNSSMDLLMAFVFIGMVSLLVVLSESLI
jgi:hypothetical protein